VAIAPSTNILAFTDKVAELFSALCGRMIGFPPEMLCNMDQAAVYFDPSSNKSIAPKGSKDVSVRQNQGASSRVTVCLTVFGDGTKLTKSPVKFWKAFSGENPQYNPAYHLQQLLLHTALPIRLQLVLLYIPETP
jgi:hypothetical protein